jgi:hypothetical protein
MIGDPSRSNITPEIKGLNWQTNVCAAVEVKSLSAALANVVQTLGEAAQALHDVIDACSDVHRLDDAARLLWKGYVEGRISDSEATYLSNEIERRRRVGRRTAPGSHVGQVVKTNGRVLSRFAPRQRQRSPDRKASRDRRRTLGGSSALPDNLRHHYTEGQRAVLCVVALEVKRHGICDWPIDKIAAVAGVGRTTVQTTMHEARRLGHITITERPRRGCKSLTNIVRISSQEWRTWLTRAPSAARLIGSNPSRMVSTTKIIDIRKKESGNEKGSVAPVPWMGLTGKGTGRRSRSLADQGVAVEKAQPNPAAGRETARRRWQPL